MCSSCIERCDSIDLTWIFRANTVATAKHRVFYESAATAITVMRGNCQVEKHGGDHRDFGKINAVGECFRQKTRELYCIAALSLGYLDYQAQKAMCALCILLRMCKKNPKTLRFFY